MIAIGNGTASRETDKLATELVKLLPDLKMSKIVVSEAGASVYSASAFASRNFRNSTSPCAGRCRLRGACRIRWPNCQDRSESNRRRAVSARPRRNQTGALAGCRGGRLRQRGRVDANTASAPLLARVSGIGTGLAQSIVQHRDANGPFKSRKALKEVPRLGPKAFRAMRRFLRIVGGEDPLDSSGVHPEAYPVVRRILAASRAISRRCSAMLRSFGS